MKKILIFTIFTQLIMAGTSDKMNVDMKKDIGYELSKISNENEKTKEEIKELREIVNKLIVIENERKELRDKQFIQKTFDVLGFKVGKYDLNPEQLILIDEMLKDVPKTSKITLVGYADKKGLTVENLKLGLNRAYSIKKYLNELGYNMVLTRSAGNNIIVDDNEDGYNNRRVNITYEISIK